MLICILMREEKIRWVGSQDLGGVRRGNCNQNTLYKSPFPIKINHQKKNKKTRKIVL